MSGWPDVLLGAGEAVRSRALAAFFLEDLETGCAVEEAMSSSMKGRMRDGRSIVVSKGLVMQEVRVSVRDGALGLEGYDERC